MIGLTRCLSIDDDELNHLERKLVEMSARRYRRAFYRWGHLVAWLVPPLLGLSFVPALKPYDYWLGWLGMLLIFHWYFVLTTRVIGKLQTRINAGT